ncbi:hypothetical protein E2L08_06000 [Palleronia sediminis]|uniref:Uncharacterized protein n=1 Tax=Palleronia sediminis TaxID=2547833 RepID=A0A4R6ADP5_9RHOB|nr:hypothetical protein [Palleronia sediminis]TDL81225.1 hypothetical protein E2L08_06000 [Palleronia sediminis]
MRDIIILKSDRSGNPVYTFDDNGFDTDIRLPGPGSWDELGDLILETPAGALFYDDNFSGDLYFVDAKGKTISLADPAGYPAFTFLIDGKPAILTVNFFSKEFTYQVIDERTGKLSDEMTLQSGTGSGKAYWTNFGSIDGVLHWQEFDDGNIYALGDGGQVVTYTPGSGGASGLNIDFDGGAQVGDFIYAIGEDSFGNSDIVQFDPATGRYDTVFDFTSNFGSPIETAGIIAFDNGFQILVRPDATAGNLNKVYYFFNDAQNIQSATGFEGRDQGGYGMEFEAVFGNRSFFRMTDFTYDNADPMDSGLMMLSSSGVDEYVYGADKLEISDDGESALMGSSLADGALVRGQSDKAPLFLVGNEGQLTAIEIDDLGSKSLGIADIEAVTGGWVVMQEIAPETTNPLN